MANAFTTSSNSRAAIHFATAPSSSSLRRLRSPAEENHGFSAMSGRPTSRITRSATDVALADTAIAVSERNASLARTTFVQSCVQCIRISLPDFSFLQAGVVREIIIIAKRDHAQRLSE